MAGDKRQFKARNNIGSITVEGVDGDDALIQMLEEALAAVKENPGIAAGPGEQRNAMFERLEVGDMFGMTHRS